MKHFNRLFWGAWTVAVIYGITQLSFNVGKHWVYQDIADCHYELPKNHSATDLRQCISEKRHAE